MRSVYFTADHHFHHKRIIEYCKRPFASVDAMNKELIALWNDTVAPGDLVYHLGDFGFGSADKLTAIRKQLNGQIIMIRGNHDQLSDTAYRERVGVEIQAPHWYRGMQLCHYPAQGDTQVEDRHLASRPYMPEGTWLLHGHVHDAWVVNGRQINVGVDVHGYRPIALEYVLEIIANNPAPQDGPRAPPARKGPDTEGQAPLSHASP